MKDRNREVPLDSNYSDIRWIQRFENFSKMMTDFEEELRHDTYTKLEMAGIIQLFNLSFDLAWKTMKDYLTYEGHEVNSPRSAIKTGYANGLIIEGEKWLELLEKRNELTHVYDKAMATEAVEVIKERYAPLLVSLKAVFEACVNR